MIKYKSKFRWTEKNEHYDTIVIGTRITVGWVAKELCNNGLNTLVSERDRKR